jgi:hypothetical protein
MKIGDKVIHTKYGSTGTVKKVNGTIATVSRTDKDGNIINVDGQYIGECIRIPKPDVFITNICNLSPASLFGERQD